MTKLFAVIKKNTKRFLRSKQSVIIIIVGPILLILLTGLALRGDSLSDLQIGYFSESELKLGDSLLSGLEERNSQIIKYSDLDSCTNDVKLGDTHACIHIPAMISTSSNIVFYIDYSNINLAYAVINFITRRFDDISQQLSAEPIGEILSGFSRIGDSIGSKRRGFAAMKAGTEEAAVKVKRVGDQLGKIEVDPSMLDFGTDQFTREVVGMEEVLEDYGDTVDDVYVNGRTRLIDTRRDVQQTRKDVDDAKNQRDMIINEFDRDFEAAGCVNKDFTDMSQYVGSDVFYDVLATHDSHCSTLFTLRESLLTNTAKLDRISQDLEDTEKRIDDSLEDLDMLYEESLTGLEYGSDRLENSKTLLSDADKKIVELKQQLEQAKTFKSSVLNDISGMEDFMQNVQANFESIDNVILEIDDKLSQLSSIDPKNIISPINTKVQPVLRGKGILDYFFPTLIVLLVMFVSTLLGETLVMKEKTSSSYFRNFILPTNDYIFILGHFLTCFFITFVQVSVIVLIGWMLFGISLSTNIGMFILVLSMVIAIFSLIGILIGIISRTEEIGIISSIITSIILFLFSGLVMPIERLSYFMSFLATLNPLYVTDSIIKKIMIYNLEFGLLKGQFITYFVEVGIIVGAVIYYTKKSKKRL